jgi:hypothetical protein
VRPGLIPGVIAGILPVMLWFVMSMLVGLAGLLGPGGRGDDAPVHLVRLRELVRDVTATDYRHRPTIVRWKTADAPATCRTDCSGLVNELLKDAYELSRADLKAWFGRERPLAIHYQRTIAAGKHFEIIGNVEGIAPGDIIAIKYPADADNSGHVMVADSVAERREPGAPLVEGTAQWSVRIIDSSNLGHGEGDSRVNSAGVFTPGLGVGTVRLYARPDGTIAGYASGPGAKSKFHSVEERPLVVGRVQPPEKVGGATGEAPRP